MARWYGLAGLALAAGLVVAGAPAGGAEVSGGGAARTCPDGGAAAATGTDRGYGAAAGAGASTAAAECLLGVASAGDVLAEVAAAAPRWGVRLTGIAVEDLRSGERWAVNGDEQMSFMSSAKLPWAVMAAAAAGSDAVEPHAYAVFAHSDNTRAGVLIDQAGGIDHVNRFWYPVLGMTRSCHGRWNAGAIRVFSGNCGFAPNPVFDVARGHTFWNYNTANDMTTLLGRLWRGDVPGLDAVERARVLEWSTWPIAAWAPDGDGTITGYLPPRTWPHVHHKVGWYFDPYEAASDAGIVDLPETTYALAIAAYGARSSAAQADFMAWASCRVYRSLSGDSGWACPGNAPGVVTGHLELAVSWSPVGSAAVSRIPAGRTSVHTTGASEIEVQVRVGPAGLAGDRLEVSANDEHCQRSVGLPAPGEAVRFTCRLVSPSAGGRPPVAHRWTATVYAGDVPVASGSAAALFAPPGSELLRAAAGSRPDAAEQLDGAWRRSSG